MPRLLHLWLLQVLLSLVLSIGLGWSDVDIFDASLMRMFTARSDDLFRLVDNRRVQLFPRKIAEHERDVAVVRATPSST